MARWQAEPAKHPDVEGVRPKEMVILTIVAVNFIDQKPFVFELTDAYGSIYWIVGTTLAKKYRLKNVFGVPEVEMYDVSWQIEATSQQIDGHNLVTKIYNYKEPGGE